MTPTDIVLHRQSGDLEVAWADGTQFSLPSELLRVRSPSAEVQGHSPDQAVLQTGKRSVRITAVEPQGNYAIRIVFSDGHDTGIFTWTYLHHLGTHLDAVWQEYLDALAAAGASRDPVVIASSR
jgi:DUF971 family protein